MNTTKNSSKLGGALAMAMMIVLIFTALAGGLFKLFQIDAVETVYVEHHSRAFWMAEAGLEKAIDRLQWDEDFRNNPGSYVPYTVPFSEGTHTNDSYKIASITITPGSTADVYTITSVGYAGNMNRRIVQDVLRRPGGPNALRAIGGDVYIDSNVHIDGDVMVDTGNVVIDSKENLNDNNPTGVDGFLVMSAGGSVSGLGAASADVIQAPIPAAPTIEMTFWGPFLTGATNNANTSGLIGVSAINVTTVISNYNYSATAPVLPSDPTLKLTISGTVNDAYNLHYMVSKTSLEFMQHTSLKSQTAIVADGDVNFRQQLSFESNCVVFATGGIFVEQAADLGGNGMTLIAQGDIVLAQNAVFTGIILAEGSVSLGPNAQVTGTVIAGGDINVGSNVDITFDPDVFLDPLPGMRDIRAEPSLKPQTWTELAPE